MKTPLVPGVHGPPRLRPATHDDLPAVLDLLAGAQLPLDGVEEHLAGFLVAQTPGDGRLVGAAGLEVHGAAALLRSLVVAPAWRGTGLGGRLAHALVESARARGLGALYLLTTTAEGYFPRLGFVRVPRAEVPPALHASAEMQGACPATAVVMRAML